jgi:monofunctional biosynthetic peptidoglycan transglycosylase
MNLKIVTSGFKSYIRIHKRSFLFISAGIGALFFILCSIVAGMPDVKDLIAHNPAETSLMRYRDVQYRKKGMRILKQQQWIPLTSVSPALIQAVLISEDDKFYAHKGFDWEGIREAFEKNFKQRHILLGGSTISQQLVKNLYLKPDRNPTRKIREAWITYCLERTLSKQRILELYLNVIEWGRGIYGIEAGAHTYYSKSASELTLNEAIRLASVLPNPIRYSPLANTGIRMIRRRERIARRMLQRHLIDEMEYQCLLTELEGKPFPAPVDDPSELQVPALADSLKTANANE